MITAKPADPVPISIFQYSAGLITVTRSVDDTGPTGGRFPAPGDSDRYEVLTGRSLREYPWWVL